jgi:very-short-patch-repair endonuclease
MAITMKEITVDQKNEFIKKITPIVKRLRKEGKSDREIEGIVYQYVQSEKKKFYNQPYPDSLKVDFIARVNNLGSKAEAIVYFFLEKYKIDFKTQYEIGRYRADFLIDNFIVLEIDGPQHDKEYDAHRDEFIRNMGYKIIRVPIWVFSVDPDSIIESIREASDEAVRKFIKKERAFIVSKINEENF